MIQALQEKRVRDEKRQAEARIQSEAQIALALARVGQGLIASLDTPTILDRLCQLVSDVLHCESSYTLLWRPQDKAFVSVARWGSTPEQRLALRLLKASREDFTEVLTRLESEGIVWQQTADAKDLFLRGLLQQLGVTECLWMALRRGGEVIGLQTAAYRIGEPLLQPQRERIGRGVAQLASLALDNARLLEQAERASRIKSDFLSMMSHELRTPLHVIMGYNSLLLEDQFDPVTPAQTDILRRIEKNAKELLVLVTATLDMSRLEARRVPLIIEAVDRASIHRRADQRNRRSTPRKDRSAPGVADGVRIARTTYGPDQAQNRAQEPARQCDKVYRRGDGHAHRLPAEQRDRVLCRRYGGRDRAGCTAAHFRNVPAGRRLNHAPSRASVSDFTLSSNSWNC